MEKFSYVDYSEFYRRNNSSQCLSIYTDKKSLLVYTGGIKVENEWLKKKRYNEVSFLQTKIPIE